MCAKWQWNARDCVTGLHDRRSRECNPVTPVDCVLHTHAFSLLSHILCNGIEMTFVWLIKYTFALHIFPIRNVLHCVDESWWDMPFKETRLGDGVADNAVAMLLPLWLHAESLWRHVFGIRIATSHNAWMGYEYSLQNVSRPRAIHKHNPRPLEQWGVCNNSPYQPCWLQGALLTTRGHYRSEKWRNRIAKRPVVCWPHYISRSYRPTVYTCNSPLCLIFLVHHPLPLFVDI